MTELNQVYKCAACGDIVTVLHPGEGQPTCHDKPMVLLKENEVDASLEKHVPVIEQTETGVLVKIGATPHPMLPEHYIEWIEIIADGKRYIQYLQPGDQPEAEFPVQAESILAREYCNLHGLWKKE